MARYQKLFELDLDDIDTIEQALRKQISTLSVKSDGKHSSLAERSEVQRLNRILGKLHNQKIFYAQVSAVGTPAG